MRWPTQAPASPRTDTAGTAAPEGIFKRLGDVVVRWPWLVIGLWIAVAVVLPPLFPPLVEATQDQPIGDLGRSGRESALAMEGF